MPATARSNPRYTASTATPRGAADRAARSLTSGLRISAMTAAIDEDQQDRAGGPRAAPRGPRIASGSMTSWIQRGTTTGSTAARAAGSVAASRRAHRSPAAALSSRRLRRQVCTSPNASTASSSSATSSAGSGARTLRALLPGLRERHAPDFVVVNGENAAGGVGHHAAGSPTSCSPPASTSSRSATTPTATARSTPTSTSSPTSCARRTSCAASPATAGASSSATACASAS